MTVIFMHDLNAAGFQDLESLLAEVNNRYGTGFAELIHGRDGDMRSSQAIIAEVDNAMPPEDREMLARLVTLSDG